MSVVPDPHEGKGSVKKHYKTFGWSHCSKLDFEAPIVTTDELGRGKPKQNKKQEVVKANTFELKRAELLNDLKVSGTIKKKGIVCGEKFLRGWKV